MTEVVTYEMVLSAYQRAIAGGNEPAWLTIRMIRRTKAVKRVIGRLLRRGIVQRGQSVPLAMHKDFGVIIV